MGGRAVVTGAAVARQLAVVAAAAGAILWATHGAWPGDRFFGIGGVDHHGTLWTWAAAADALSKGDPALLLTTPWFFHPWGQAWFEHTGGNLLDALVALPLAPLGRVAGHNVALLAVVALNGLGGWLGARRLGSASPGAAAVAMIVAPYPLYELVEGRPTQALLVFGPLFAAEVALCLAPGRRGSAVRAGAYWAGLGYSYWFYAVFAGVCLGFWAAARLALDRRKDAPAVLVPLLAASAIALLLALPVAGPLLLALGRDEVPGRLGGGATLLLHSFQPTTFASGYLDGDGFVRTQRALPVAALIAAGLWARRGAREGAPVLLAGLAAVGLAVGPVVLVGGQLVREPLYDLLLAAFPPLTRLWHPARALAVIAVLTALAVANLPGGPRWALVALLAGESGRDGLLPLPTWDARVPAGYQCLAAGDDGGALIELPWASTPAHLGWIPVHRRPILGGMWETEESFQPPEAVALRRDPWLGAVLALARGEAATPGDSTAVHDLGFRYVVLRRDELPRGDDPGQRAQRRRVEAGLRDALGPPAWDDARTSIWAPWGDPLPCAARPPPPDTTLGDPISARRVLDLGEGGG